ncbi:hypothetical protein FRC19_001415, partial [Serendipita sp. 401]
PIAGALFLSNFASAAPTKLNLGRRDNPEWALTGSGSGCWADNTNGQRALDKSLGGFDDLTPAKCQSLCDAQGFNLAGVEFGRECFCGNTIIGNNQPSDSSCTMACSGDSAQTCGGTDAINIYVKDGFQYTVGPAWALDIYNGFADPQCWHDSAGSRILASHPSPEIPSDQMTVQKCIDGCAAAGYSSAGLEFGKECYCGNASNPLADSAELGECNMPCLGDATKYCGGANRLLLYHNPNNDEPQPTPKGSWNPAQDGCWTDSVHDRALQKFIGGYDDLTPAKCQSLCENAGFNLAGVEYARECCKRLLKQSPAPPISYDLMTVQKCIDGCAAAGFSSAGVEYGGECYCDNVTYPPGQSQDMSECNMACTGDASEICGGPDRILIYYKPDAPTTTTYTGVIEVHDSASNDLLGYITKDTQNGISKYSTDLSNAETFTFEATTGSTVEQAEITAQDGIDGYPFLGLIEGYANNDSTLGDGNWQYLFVGGTSHSAPGATPQTGANSYWISSREWESSVWTINSATGDITPQWINPDGSKPHTALIGWYGYILFAGGDVDDLNAHFGHSDKEVKLKFNANPLPPV